MMRRSALGSAGRPFRVVAWLAILAFLLQGLIVQTHIHVASLEAAAPVQHSQAGSPAKAPTDKAPADCPACQLQAATAAFVLAPHAVSLALVQWVMAGVLSLPTVNIQTAPIRSWSSRAPPRR